MKRVLAVDLIGPVFRRRRGGRLELTAGSKRAIKWLRNIGWQIWIVAADGATARALLEEAGVPFDAIRLSGDGARFKIMSDSINFMDWGRALLAVKKATRITESRRRFIGGRNGR